MGNSLPPSSMIVESGGGGPRVFKQVGEEFVRYFIDIASLGKHERVLDVGCGPGRIAVQLTQYLNADAKYEGFDITRHQIDWCTKRITSRYPNFRFQLADIFNSVYNPNGKCNASDYSFPFQNEQFDFVFLISVFTHMLPDDISHYLAEINRVLKQSGRSFMTFFLLNEESRELIRFNTSSLNFNYDHGDWATITKDSCESAVAYDERFVQNLCELNGLTIREPIYYGSWCGRKASARDVHFSYQDMLMAYKRSN